MRDVKVKGKIGEKYFRKSTKEKTERVTRWRVEEETATHREEENMVSSGERTWKDCDRKVHYSLKILIIN